MKCQEGTGHKVCGVQCAFLFASIIGWHAIENRKFEYLNVLEQHHDRLDDFYNRDDMRFKWHGWDIRRAGDEEYKVIANRLLNLVGWSISAKCKDGNHVVIRIGLGQFSCKTGLNSPQDRIVHSKITQMTSQMKKVLRP